MKKVKYFTGIVMGWFLLFPFTVVHAALSGSATGGTGSTGGGGFLNPIGFDSLRDFLLALLQVIITIAFPIIVLAVVYTGFLFVSARGSEEKLKTAKKALVWTLVGAMIILGAFVIANAIKETVDEIKNADAGPAHVLVINSEI